MFHVTIETTSKTQDDIPSARHDVRVIKVKFYCGTDLRYEREYIEIPTLEIWRWIK